MKIQVLMTPDCPHGEQALALVADVVRQHAARAEVEVITVTTTDDAERWSFPGSPTVRVNGADVEPDAPKDTGLG